jgi:hypothetical protein
MIEIVAFINSISFRKIQQLKISISTQKVKKYLNTQN